jgi:hypothetical protein
MMATYEQINRHQYDLQHKEGNTHVASTVAMLPDRSDRDTMVQE